MITSRELALSPFESALLSEKSIYQHVNRPFIGKFLIVLAVALFSLFSSPRLQASEQSLSLQGLLELTNQDRAQVGVSALEENLKLDQAAAAKARDILDKGYFSHVAPSGTKPWDFIKETGFEYAFAGENLALNYASSFELQRDFMSSPSHRENLLSPFFSHVGIAIVNGTFQGQSAVVTVVMFGSPRLSESEAGTPK